MVLGRFWFGVCCDETAFVWVVTGGFGCFGFFAWTSGFVGFAD